MNSMKAFRKHLFGATARRTLQAVIAVAALIPAAATAADLPDNATQKAAMNPSMDPSMDHVAMPVIPASLTWVMTAPAGGWMFNYNPTFMRMGGVYVGSSTQSPATIATTIPSGMTHPAGGKAVPTDWRIIPTSMDMQMHMFNGMYGVTDALTIMASGSYVSKSMDMTSFSGMSGTTVLGQSSGTTDGLGDTMFGAEYKLYQDSMNRVVIGLMASAPTASITRQVSMLSPKTGTDMLMRAPYGMQSGTGTWDLLPDVAYLGVYGPWSWGAAYRGRFALDYNANGWRFGDLHEFHGWGAYQWTPWFATTGHVIGTTQDHIHGADANINGLSPMVDPLDYGGQRVTLLGGFVVSGAPLGYGNASLALEAGAPVYQHLNGPQLGQDWQVTLSARVMF